ncbi:MFS transporter [Streptomyces roseolus]|uniref:MFS transporter n=1 Tax=Streptomyces roseolus TaxID=67358 RepID=UPI001674245E|nr:MFS transporter [Streptomyces roseolus]GGR35176.1 MFS transporter [Streptomyces roseolus]
MLSSAASSAGLSRTYLMRATDAMASATATYAIPLLVLVTTGSTTVTGLAFLLEWVPRLGAFAFSGSLVDRWGAGLVFRMSNLVRATVVALVGGLLFALPSAGAVTTGVVLVFGAVSGLLAEVSFVAVETLGAETSRRMGGQAHRVQAVQTGIDQGAVLVGPLLGGVLLLMSPAVLLAVVALLAMIAAVSASGDVNGMERSAVSSSLRTGWATFRRTPALVWLIGGLAASNLATGLLQAAAPITVVRHFHASTAAVGAVWSAAAVASLVAVWVSRRAIDRFGIWWVGVVSAAAATSACLATALAPSFAVYTVTMAVVMAGEGVMVVVLRTLRARLIPAQAYGSTLAVTMILVLLPIPLAGALVAAVPASGLPHLLLGCAAVQGLALAACFAGLRRRQDACEPPRPTAPAHREETSSPVGVL